MATIAIDQIINSYKVVRKLGEGGMGAVYEVVHTVLGKPAALKVLNADFQRHSTLVARFGNEAKILAKLDHPSIIKVIDFGQLEDGTLFYIMEFMRGESLAQHIESCRRRPGDYQGLEFAPLLADLASGLAAAHRLGIIHRDLKPANVMVVNDPLSPIGVAVKLLDFGIAKLPGDPRTEAGSHLGTPIYMAPEQIRDPARVDGQADLYSLGVIAYELLSGQLPYEQRDTMAVLLAKTIDPPRPLSQFAPDLPAPLLSLVMRLLMKEPEQRGTVAGFEVELRQILGLRLPRQSGIHDALEPLDPTADVPPAVISAFDVLPPTPTDQKLRGEISPSGIAVPKSLGSMPSLPVPAPPLLRAAPEERTTKTAPEIQPAVVLASPARPTRAGPDRPPTLELPDPPAEKAAPALQPGIAPAGPSVPVQPEPSNRPALYLMGAILALGVITTAGVVWWPRQPSVQPAKLLAGQPIGAPPPPLTSTPPLTAPPTTAPPSPSVATAAPSTVTSTQSKPVAQQPSATTAKAAREPQYPTESCILTDMSKAQRTRLLGAFKGSGAKLRPGEKMVISGFPHYPQITTAPASLNADGAEAYELTGLLRNADLPAQVELKCRAK